mmetsp:Transcript_24173/g.72130  ORF Transcript_24173/g.72130 Transcript_24173/m.72130 type:complete len:207 (+) Transcript_24173:1371-1991(+)
MAPGQHAVNRGSALPSTEAASPSTDAKMGAASAATSAPKLETQKSSQNASEVNPASHPRRASADSCGMTSWVRHCSPIRPCTSGARLATSRVRLTHSSGQPSASSDSNHGMIHAACRLTLAYPDCVAEPYSSGLRPTSYVSPESALKPSVGSTRSRYAGSSFGPSVHPAVASAKSQSSLAQTPCASSMSPIASFHGVELCDGLLHE